MFDVEKANKRAPKKEKAVEAAVVRVLKSQGWTVFKLQFVAVRGAPDRIAIKDGHVIFVEVKREKGGKVSDVQRVMHETLADAGATVFIVSSAEDMKAALVNFELMESEC